MMDKTEQLFDILNAVTFVSDVVEDNNDSHWLAMAAGKLSVAISAIRKLYENELELVREKRKDA